MAARPASGGGGGGGGGHSTMTRVSIAPESSRRRAANCRPGCVASWLPTYRFVCGASIHSAGPFSGRLPLISFSPFSRRRRRRNCKQAAQTGDNSSSSLRLLPAPLCWRPAQRSLSATRALSLIDKKSSCCWPDPSRPSHLPGRLARLLTGKPATLPLRQSASLRNKKQTISLQQP